MQTQSLKPSLDNAYARARRAKQHITRLKREIRSLRRPEHVVSIPAGTTGLFVDISTAAPTIISVLVGEAVYNLRAALDYLVYELAILDSGQIQESTQFPIEDAEKDPGKIKAWIKSWGSGRTGDFVEYRCPTRQ